MTLGHRPCDIFFCIQNRIPCFFIIILHDVIRIFPNKFSKLKCSMSTIDRSAESITHQFWDASGMIEVCVTHDDSIKARRIKSKIFMIFLLIKLSALKHSAIKKDLLCPRVDKMTGASDFMCRSKKGNIHKKYIKTNEIYSLSYLTFTHMY